MASEWTLDVIKARLRYESGEVNPIYAYVVLNNPSGSTLWDFPFKYHTTILYRKHGNTWENLHPTITLGLKYYIPEFIVFGESSISHRTSCITLGFHQLRHVIGEVDPIIYVLYLIVPSSPLYRIDLMARH